MHSKNVSRGRVPRTRSEYAFQGLVPWTRSQDASPGRVRRTRSKGNEDAVEIGTLCPTGYRFFHVP